MMFKNKLDNPIFRLFICFYYILNLNLLNPKSSRNHAHNLIIDRMTVDSVDNNQPARQVGLECQGEDGDACFDAFFFGKTPKTC